MESADIVKAIRDKFEEYGNIAQIPFIKKGRGSFEAKLLTTGIEVNNLDGEPFLPWEVFTETISLLQRNGGRAARGNAIGPRLGDPELTLNSVEGYIAHKVFGKQVGEIVFRRVTPIACILIWVGLCRHGVGELILNNSI